MFSLREIEKERHLQEAAQLEVTTVKAASNILFRAWVGRKVSELRQRFFLYSCVSDKVEFCSNTAPCPMRAKMHAIELTLNFVPALKKGKLDR